MKITRLFAIIATVVLATACESLDWSAGYTDPQTGANIRVGSRAATATELPPTRGLSKDK